MTYFADAISSHSAFSAPEIGQTHLEFPVAIALIGPGRYGINRR